MTIEKFKTQVMDNTDGQIKTIDLYSNATVTDEDGSTKSMTIGELTKNKFLMKINNSEYHVYPDLRSLTGTGRDHIDSTKYKKELDKLNGMQQSIAIYRQIALKHFYERFVYAVKKQAGNKGKITQTQLDTAFKNAVAEFKAHNQDPQRAQRIRNTLNGFKAELAQLQKQRDNIAKQSHKKAGMALALGMFGTTAQLVGFTVGIYVISDWNEMEPWTFIIQAFYMMVGSWYFMGTKADWDYTQIYKTLE